MASKLQKGKPLGIEVPPVDLPPRIAALFVIRFDIKTGYVVSWKRSLPDVEIDGVVEYKSLPSGLHNVVEDLVYFVHEKCAGVSYFLNKPAGETERNAMMFAIGVLVPLSLGRLGKGWKHARHIKELAHEYVKDMSNTQLLSEYWEMHQIRESESFDGIPDSPLDSPVSMFKNPGELLRGQISSDAMVLESPRPGLAPYHPASSLSEFIDCFGPLVFPLYRTALLRKRILLVTEAPVHLPSDYVYALSLISSLPNSLIPLLPSDDFPAHRPRPLFNIGVHDITLLSSFVGTDSRPGKDRSWIACTTDSVLGMKSDLYDVLVTLPPPYSKNAAKKVYPQIVMSCGKDRKIKRNSVQVPHLKATQRDVRRFTTLRKGMRRFFHSENSSSIGSDEEDFDTASTFSSASIVEPLPWPRRAYTSFIWWASAGEKRGGLTEDEEEQDEQDERLLITGDNISSLPTELPVVALVTYFRRLTTQIFVTVSDAIARHDGDDNDESALHDDDDESEDDNDPPSTEGDDSRVPLLDRRNPNPAPHTEEWERRGRKRKGNDRDAVKITTADMLQMGLDVWSATDRIFVQQLVSIWWGREAVVQGARITCCGIPIF